MSLADQRNQMLVEPARPSTKPTMTVPRLGNVPSACLQVTWSIGRTSWVWPSVTLTLQNGCWQNRMPMPMNPQRPPHGYWNIKSRKRPVLVFWFRNSFDTITLSNPEVNSSHQGGNPSRSKIPKVTKNTVFYSKPESTDAVFSEQEVLVL